MARGPFVDPEVRQIVARLVAGGEHSPAAIYRALQHELDKEYEGKTGVRRPWLPTERTIGRLVQKLAAHGPPDEREPWSLVTAEPNEAAVIMPILGALLADSSALLAIAPDDRLVAAVARSRRVPQGLAKWILKVAAAAPTLPPDWVYTIAREYRAWELQAARGTPRRYVIDPASLDACLACRPWESEEAAERYERLIEQGILGQPIYIGRWWRNILEREQSRRKLHAMQSEIDQGKE